MDASPFLLRERLSFRQSIFSYLSFQDARISLIWSSVAEKLQTPTAQTFCLYEAANQEKVGLNGRGSELKKHFTLQIEKVFC